jgi:outer membrane protein insertion porin family
VKLRPAAALALIVLTGLSSASAQSTACVVSKIEVTGNRRVTTDSILSWVVTPIGDPMDISIVDDDLRAIYRMGEFDSVRARARMDGDLCVLIFEVAEKAK